MRKVDPFILQTFLKYFKVCNRRINDMFLGTRMKLFYRVTTTDGIYIGIYDGTIIRAANTSNCREYTFRTDKELGDLEINYGLPIRIERVNKIEEKYLMLFDELQGINWWITYA